MASSIECRERIAGLDGTPCSKEHCEAVLPEMESYCHDQGYRGATPVPQLVNGEICYCCCGVLPAPQVAIGACETRPASALEVDDEVWAAGPGLIWSKRQLRYSAALVPPDGQPAIAIHHGADQTAVYGPTALLLLETGALSSATDIVPGDRLRCADGTVSEVTGTRAGETHGALYHLHTGPFDGRDLSGHLLDIDGLVVADFMVQLTAEVDGLDPALIARARDGKSAATGRHFPLPAGFRERVTAIPKNAASFWTDAQALDIDEQNDHVEVPSVMDALLDQYRASYPDIRFSRRDPDGTPNGFAFIRNGIQRVVLTGTPIGVNGLAQDGIAIMLAHLVAAVERADCVGQADYDGVFLVLRKVWPGSQFVSVYMGGIAELEVAFGYVSPKNAASNPLNICHQPSLDCRLEVYAAAAAMYEIPVCATGKAGDQLGVVRAVAGQGNVSVTVQFTDKVGASATNPDNYAISVLQGNRPQEVVVLHAQVTGDGKQAGLSVTELQRGGLYQLTVTNVVGRDGSALNPQQATVDFTAAE